MAYIINRFDGTQLTIVDDGILDTSTPVGLIGRNYTGYGEVQNENFIFLLENFANASPPARALSGQAWYDKGAKALKVFNGTTWLSIGNATVSEIEPAHSNGGLWLKTTTQQLFVSDGVTWRQVGPEAAEGFAVTKMTSTVIKDSLGANKPAILSQINGETTAIIVNEDFVINPATEIPGFSQLNRGINLKSTNYFSGALKGNADSATKLETTRKINTVDFNGTSDITITSVTNQPLKAGDFIIGSEFNGAFETTWDINATSENLIGTVVARNSVGGFSATIINSDLFGDVQGNVTALTGTSTFNEIVVNTVIGETFSGLAGRATKLETPRLINTVPFNGTENITLPVPAETLVGTTLAPNVVDSVLTSLGKLVALEVEAPGIIVGDGNNLNIKIEGFTPTLESDVSNAIKLKLLTGSVRLAPSTITFVSANASSADGILSPAFVPDYTLSTPANQRPVLGLPSYRWRDIYSEAATVDLLKVTTISGRTVADEVTVSNKLIVNNGTYSALFGNVTGNVVGNVTGAASLNMLKAGDTLTGDISWTTSGRGLTWSMNTDGASIRYYNTGDGALTNRLEFNTSDNTDEFFRWTHTVAGSTYESMRLTPNIDGNANLSVTGSINITGTVTGTHRGDGNQVTNLNAANLANGTVPSARLVGTYNISIAGNVAGNVTGNLQGNVTGNLQGNVTGNVTGSSSLNVLRAGDSMTGDLNIVKDNAWLVLDSPSIGTDGQYQAAGISLGESGYKGSATLHFTYTGDGYGHIGMGPVDSLTSLPQFEAIRLYYLDNTVRVLGNMTVAGTASGTFSGTGTGLTLNASNLTTGIIPTGRLSGAYSITVDGNAGSASRLATSRTINGVGFDGTASINVSEYIHSNRDFASGTLITTNINYAVSEGEPWVLEIKGNSYGSLIPWDIQYQGYIYSGTIINHGGISNGTNLTGLIAVNSGGVLCFWFPRQAYWQGFNVKVYVPYATVAANRVTSIIDSGQPGSTKLVSLSANIRQSLHTGNYNSYVPTLVGVGASGVWPISINGNASTVSTLNSAQISSALGYTPVNPGNLTNQSGTAISGSTGSFTGRISQSISGFHAASIDDISVRTNSGFFDNPYPTVAKGWPVNGSWYHLLSSTHVNDANYYAMQFSADFYAQNLYYRSTGGNGATAWNKILHNNNYNNYSPTLTGGNASGTWPINISGTAAAASSVAWNNISSKPGIAYNDGGTYSINVTGNAGTSTSTRYVQAPDGSRNPNDILPYSSGHAVRFDFSNAGYVGTGGNYAGVMTYTPWDGTTASTGDASYQLAFGSTTLNGGGTPQLRIRKGIDSSWNSWYDLLTSANYNNYSPTLTGGNASGTWGINITGNAGTVSSISGAQVTAALGYTPANGSGAGSINGTQNYQDNILVRAAIQDYSLVHNALTNVSGGTTINMELGNYVSATAVGAVTWIFSNPPTGARAGSIILELTNGGAYTQYWPAAIRWPSGSAPNLAASGVDVLVFITDDGGANWRGAISMGDSR